MRNTITKIGARSNAIDAYRPLLVDLAAFDAGANVKGRRYSGGVAYMVADPANVGQLPQHYREQFAADATLIDYVVWSYETPIAWHVADVDGGPSTGYDGFWEIPWVRYSQTTSQHQARITGAIRHANAAGGRMDRRPAGPFVNLMTGRGHRGITPGWQSGGTPEERGVPTLRESPWTADGWQRAEDRVQAPEPEPVKPEWTPRLRTLVQWRRMGAKLGRRYNQIDRIYEYGTPEWHYARSDHKMIRLNLDYIALGGQLNMYRPEV